MSALSTRRRRTTQFSATYSAGFRSVVKAIALLVAWGSLTGTLRPAAADDGVSMPDLVQQLQSSATPLSDLTGEDNGPGVVVCSPVSPVSLQNFARGVGSWINLIVGSDPRCGKTPTLSNDGTAGDELGHPRLDLSLAQADRLAQMEGVTVAVVGTLTGTSQQCRLTYRVYSVPINQRMGNPITIQGSAEGITAQLPAVAGAIFERLGMTPAGIPASTGLSASDVSFLGSADNWDGIFTLTKPAQDRLHALAKRSLLGAILWFRSLRLIQGTYPAAELIVSMDPKNGLALADMSEGPQANYIRHQDIIVENHNRAPSSYLYATACSWLYTDLQQPALARRAAEETVKCAYSNPHSWLTLGSTIADECELVRQGRTFNDMEPPVQDYVTATYPDWEWCCKHATMLDPLNQRAWTRLSTAATFAGDRPVAGGALWKAMQLGPDFNTFEWGLQMYQSKWFDDPDNLVKVANLTEKAAYLSRGEVTAMVHDLQDAGFSVAAQRLQRRYAGKFPGQ